MKKLTVTFNEVPSFLYRAQGDHFILMTHMGAQVGQEPVNVYAAIGMKGDETKDRFVERLNEAVTAMFKELEAKSATPVE